MNTNTLMTQIVVLHAPRLSRRASGDSTRAPALAGDEAATTVASTPEIELLGSDVGRERGDQRHDDLERQVRPSATAPGRGCWPMTTPTRIPPTLTTTN